ncbi:5-methylcytosine restriction system component-like protein [Myxococcus stipitatus DSM 14675]|uniref:5-methylcytosine restriction system component-like protein n=1 Tax=Myxococcus stipitatus (strain DSM 14675 / JCM 12634 / Mx s8) TaxID=1278073 RepID=L7UL94_MYXSD|nr:5-methylcytosine restriction system component-like protein [Myxococcus stipitatus]AGC47224.1 5-methylcytosine restriction system component-like protein [Myxococcus stipitatus DSM 14675]
MRTIHLMERGTTSDVALTADEVRFLRSARAGVSILASGKAGVYDLKASQVIGTLVGPTFRLLIQPKLPVRRVLYLLGYMRGTIRLDETTILGEAGELAEVMQLLFMKALERALRGGLVRGYVSREEELAAMRGRLDVGGLVLRRFGVVPPLPCTYDELTIDTEPNRRLLAAAVRLAVLPGGKMALAQRLRELVRGMEGIRLIHYGRTLSVLPPDRRYAHFAEALALADMVLRNSSVELREGDVSATGLLVDMEELYEGFVFTALGEVLSESGRWERHPPDLYLDEARRVKLEPDILWSSARGEPRLVLDAKYKSSVQGMHADLYQALAYCTALGLRTGILLYADTEESVHRIPAAGIALHVVRFDPDGEPDELRNRARQLAARLEELVAAGRAAA